MKRFRVTFVQIITIYNDQGDPTEEVDKDDLHDSLMDTALDDQDSLHQTSDDKFSYVRGVIEKLKLEEVQDENPSS